jgi:hypothetical protein
MALTITYRASDIYVASIEGSLATSVAYFVGDTAETLTYYINCDQQIDSVACLGTEVYYTFELTDDIGITTSSVPVKWDSSSGLLTVYTTDNGDAGSLSYVVTVKMYEDSTDDLISSLDYSMDITITAPTYTSVAESPGTSVSYTLLDTADTITFSIGCTVVADSSACTDA